MQARGGDAQAPDRPHLLCTQALAVAPPTEGGPCGAAGSLQAATRRGKLWMSACARPASTVHGWWPRVTGLGAAPAGGPWGTAIIEGFAERLQVSIHFEDATSCDAGTVLDFPFHSQQRETS